MSIEATNHYNKLRRESFFGSPDIKLDRFSRILGDNVNVDKACDQITSLIASIRQNMNHWRDFPDSLKEEGVFNGIFARLDARVAELLAYQSFLAVKLRGSGFNLTRSAAVADWMPVFLIVGSVAYNIFKSYVIDSHDDNDAEGKSLIYASTGVLTLGKLLQNQLVLSSPKKVEKIDRRIGQIKDLLEDMTCFAERYYDGKSGKFVFKKITELEIKAYLKSAKDLAEQVAFAARERAQRNGAQLDDEETKEDTGSQVAGGGFMATLQKMPGISSLISWNKRRSAAVHTEG